MAYASVAQADGDPLTEERSHTNSALTTSMSPTIPQLPLDPFSLHFDQLSGDVAVDDPIAKATTNRDSKVSKILSSLTGSSKSYDLVEDDDYEELDATVRRQLDNMASSSQRELDLPVRTASVSRQLPLKHPKPDLQSLQGAYVKNVERLEESAERLSMSSSLGELRRTGIQQGYKERTTSGSSKESPRLGLHKASATSLSNPIVDFKAAARSGGYSPAGYVGSPVGSAQSSRNAQTNISGRQFSRTSNLNPVAPESSATGWTREEDVHVDATSSRSPERPGSAGSGDTYQQARNLFTDFDGVHYTGTRASRRISLSHPPRARDSRAFKEPQPGEEMIYYPAPVPVMLNLPVRLSKMNWNDREKKRLQALSEMPDDMRKSAPWLANEEVASPPSRPTATRLPPQLRASAFFDHKGTEMNVQLKDGSAVATLDSILDAAAHAPVSAFTDHPIAGHLGKEVYGPSPTRKSMQAQKRKSKHKSSLAHIPKAKGSRSDLGIDDHDSKKDRLSDIEDKENESDNGSDAHDAASGSENGAEEGEEQSGSESESGDESHHPGFSKAPTTLLAELQMRKAQQKQRNRTAADAFPNGMHSTLLELDTVTQLQQKARKQKHITLAWEDHEEADRENFDDDDVPLGMLYPDKDHKDTANVNRPLGLMEKRELEENEPLSMRRARLKGQPLMPPSVSKSPSHVDEAPRIEESTLEETPEETLGQRMKRLRELKENGSTSDFVREVNSELGLPVPEPQPPKAKTPDPEETLGQRRRRLKEEAAMNGDLEASRPTLKTTGSMADLLQRNPVQYIHPNEGKTAATAMQTYQQQLQRDPAFLAQQQAAAMMNQGFGAPPGTGMMGMQSPYVNYPYRQQSASYLGSNMQIPIAGYGMAMPTATGPNQATLPFGMSPYGNPAAGFDMGPPLNAKQRATIDQWRQGIA